ncbi:MAG TPA: hypothetical protein VID75_07990 [Acidimicrobiales bacterium]
MLLIHDPRDPERLVARSSRSRDRLVARVFASALDRRLAQGVSPESNVLLALRAQILARPETRRAIARNWDHLVRVARGEAVSRVPLRRHHIVTAESDIADMRRALLSELPAPARGVAMAAVLLRDGAGPLYNGRSAVDLRRAVQDVTARLDPASSLVASA